MISPATAPNVPTDRTVVNVWCRKPREAQINQDNVFFSTQKTLVNHVKNCPITD